MFSFIKEKKKKNYSSQIYILHIKYLQMNIEYI